MKINICVGSSCHLKGSRQIADGLQKLIKDNGLQDKIELIGTFCFGKCQTGVNIKVDDEFFSVTPETVEDFFNNTVLPRLN